MKPLPGDAETTDAMSRRVDAKFLQGVHKEQKHPLLLNKTYSKVGGNDAVTALPSVMHFGGYKLGKVHRQKLRLLNKSRKVQRMHVINPTTKYFRVPPSEGRKSSVAPGMAEEITIEL